MITHSIRHELYEQARFIKYCYATIRPRPLCGDWSMIRFSHLGQQLFCCDGVTAGYCLWILPFNLVFPVAKKTCHAN